MIDLLALTSQCNTWS